MTLAVGVAVALLAVAVVWFFGPGAQRVQNVLRDEHEALGLPPQWEKEEMDLRGGANLLGDRGRLWAAHVADEPPEQVCGDVIAALERWSGQQVEASGPIPSCEASAVRRRLALGVRRILAHVTVEPAEQVAGTTQTQAASRVRVQLTDTTH